MARLLRRVIKVTAWDSPNVRLALEERAAGLPVSNRIVTPGVLTYEDLCSRLVVWDKIRQTVGLSAEFYEGPGVLLFPPEFLNRAERMADALRGQPRRARAIGIDPGEGAEETCQYAIDELGVIAERASLTPDTSVIEGDVLNFAREHGVPSHMVMTDLGGGGRHLACALAKKGFPITTVAFGSPPDLDMKRGMHQLKDRKDIREERYAYVSRRAQMYHELSLLLELDGQGNPLGTVELSLDGLSPRRLHHGFAIPREFTQLRKELAPIPKLMDGEGRYYLPPKDKPGDEETKKVTLKMLCGSSPNRADALVVAVAKMLHKGTSKVRTDVMGI